MRQSIKTSFPKDLSVEIKKDGDHSAKIHVKRGNKEWDVTDEKLGDLPEDIRPHVERMLGQPGAPYANWLRVSPGGKIDGELKIAPLPPVPLVALPLSSSFSTLAPSV